VRASSSWLAHLRAGGTTPWAAYALDPARANHDLGEDHATRPVTPGAQQLEVLRRLNALGRVSPALADRVLRADLAGRGHGLLGLAGEDHRRFGTPPVDPAALPLRELLRVVIGLLAEDVVTTGVPPLPPAHRPRLRRVRYRLSGDPWLAVPAREDLVRRGYPQGGGRAVTFLVGRDLSTMLADAWTWRSLVNGTPAWNVWLNKLRRADRLPARADLARQARWWAQRVGGHNVRIVTDPALLPQIFRVDTVAQPPTLSADAVELARLVAPMVSLHAGGERRELMLRGLVPRLTGAAGAPLAVPERWQEWVAGQARLVHRELTSGDYAVLGDPDLILGRSADGGAPSEPAVLTLALRTLLENDPDSRVEGA